MQNRIVMLADFDYFFAQCEELRNPVLKDKPVVVGVYSGRTEESGAVSTSNYIARKLGVKHVTCSTYKAKPDNWRRLSENFPKVTEQLKPLYFQLGEKVGGSTLMPKDLRFKMLKEVRDSALVLGMQFGVCREGLAQLNTAPCDGSYLMPNREKL